MYERNETEAERLDRNWDEMLQELRVVQTGVQLLAGFLLTLPFSDRFVDLDTWQLRLYLAIVLLAALAVGVTLVPIGVHRRVFRQRVKGRAVATGHALVQVVIGLLALIIVGITTLIFSVAVSWTAALVVAAGTTAVLLVLLVLVPAGIARRNAGV
jgi:Family of unknown function (DUF6328)